MLLGTFTCRRRRLRLGRRRALCAHWACRQPSRKRLMSTSFLNTRDMDIGHPTASSMIFELRYNYIFQGMMAPRLLYGS